MTDRTETQIKAEALREFRDEYTADYFPHSPVYRALTERADELDPPLPPEPLGDVVVKDSEGDFWTRVGRWWCSGVICTWPELLREHGPVTIYDKRVES